MPNNPLHPKAYSYKSFEDDLIKKDHFQQKIWGGEKKKRNP